MRFEGAGTRAAGWLGLALALGLLGAALDQIHVQSDLLAYPHPWLWDQAAWVPLNFAVLLTALVAASVPIAQRAALPPPGGVRLAADVAWFAGAYALSGLVAPDEPGLLAAAYLVTWIPRIALRPGGRVLLPYGIALALAGCAVEALEIELGWFAYADPDVAGVPLWLAGIYLHGAPLALDVAARVATAGLAGPRP